MIKHQKEGMVMSEIRDFLIATGFEEELVDEYDWAYNEHCYDLDSCERIYTEILTFIREEFDDDFALAMFLHYSSVFSSSCIDQLLAVKAYFNSDMWATYVAYEYGETGTSSVFELMDVMVVGYFESHLAAVCDKVKAVWVNDYGKEDLVL